MNVLYSYLTKKLSIISLSIMIWFYQIQEIIEYLLNFISSLLIFIFIIGFIILYHIFLYLTKDKKDIKALNKYKDPEEVDINHLKDFPLLTIVIPAWNEGETFRSCLESITHLTYPKINVIVNAGGSEKTIAIANSFKKYDYFKIISQEGGGKIKALNECLPHIKEGIIYLVDADVYFTDEIVLRLLIPLVNQGEYVSTGSIKPLKHQEHKDLVKYLDISRDRQFKTKFTRYRSISVSGANTCVKYEVIKEIGKFRERLMFPEDNSRGQDIISKGFKIYQSKDYRSRLYSYYPDTLKKLFSQRIRMIENDLFYSYHQKKYHLVRFFLFAIASIYFLILPILLFIEIRLFILGIYVLFFLYLIKMRRIIFYKNTVEKRFQKDLTIKFYFKIFFYIYIDFLNNIAVIFDLLFFRKNYKKRKNLLISENSEN